MAFTKEQLKKSAILTLPFAGALEYTGAMISNSLPALKGEGDIDPVSALSYYFSNPIENIMNALSTPFFMEMQPFLIGAALYLAGKGLWEQTTYKDASSYGAYGTSRWATTSEMFNKEDITSDLDRESSILARYGKKTISHHQESELNRNALIVGGSGAGKTSARFIPNLMMNKNKSIVVIDPKGELYEKTSQLKREQGYKVHLVNFKNRDISDRYNPFDYIKKDADAYKVSKAFVMNSSNSKGKDDFWNLSQASLLQAFILYVKYQLPKEMHHMGSVMNLAQIDYQKMAQAFLEFPDGHIVKKAYQTALERLQEKTLDNAFATLMNTLNPWMYDDVCKFTYKSDFLFQDAAKEKTIVYVIIPINDDEFRPLISMFFTQMFSELYELAEQNFGQLPVNLLMELDEFANIGMIPEFEKKLSTTRSLGIEISMGIQDIVQLERVYGKECAKEIIANCDIRMLMKATEYDAAQYFSRMAGKTTVEIKSNSTSKSDRSASSSESKQVIQRDLITPDEILRMKKNEMLLFVVGYYPMKVHKASYFKMKYFKNLIREKVSRNDYPLADRTEYKVYKSNELEVAIDLINEKQIDEQNILPDPDHKTTLSEVMKAIKKEDETEEPTEVLEDENNEEEKDSVDELLATFKF